MPADTYSNILGWLTMGTGNDNNSWGDNANISIFTILEKAIAGYATHAVTGGTLLLDNVIPPTGPTSALEMIHGFTGVLLSDEIVQVPNLPKMWIARNQCTGNFTLKFKTLTGSASAAIPQGGWAFVWCDGNDVCSVGLSTSLRDVQWLGADGAVGAPGLSFTGEPSTGIYRKSAGVVGISILGVEIFEITAAGVNVTSGALSVAGSQVIPAGAEMSFPGIEAPSGWLFCDGTSYARSTYANLLGALSKTCTGNTHTNTTLDNLSADLRGKGLEGAFIEGTGIVTGTTIVTINSATSLTLSQATTGTSSGITVRILPHGQGDGSTTFNVPDRRYRALVGRDDMNNNNASRSSSFAGKKLSTSGGAETVALAVSEMPAHAHPGSTVAITDPGHTHTTGNALIVGGGGGSGAGAEAIGPITINPSTTGITATPTIASQGGGGAHNNMGPFGITNWIIKT